MKFGSQITKLIQRPRWHVFVLFAVVFVPVAWYGATSIPFRHHFHASAKSWGIDRYEQGWPFPFFEFDTPNFIGPKSFGMLDRCANTKVFYTGRLLANLANIICIAGVPALLWHIHTAGHERPWQFSIREMFGGILFVAVILSFWRYHEYQYQAEQKAKRDLEKAGWACEIYQITVIHPALIVNEPAILPYTFWRPWYDFNIPIPRCFYRVKSVGWSTLGPPEAAVELDQSRWDNVNDMLCDIGPRLQVFEHCEELIILDDQLEDRGLFAILSYSNKNLIVVNLHGSYDIIDKGIKCIIMSCPRLEKLVINHTGITDECATYLTRAKHLYHIGIGEAPRVTPNGRRQIAKLQVSELYVPDQWLEDDPELIDIMFGDED